MIKSRNIVQAQYLVNVVQEWREGRQQSQGPCSEQSKLQRCCPYISLHAVSNMPNIDVNRSIPCDLCIMTKRSGEREKREGSTSAGANWIHSTTQSATSQTASLQNQWYLFPSASSEAQVATLRSRAEKK